MCVCFTVQKISHVYFSHFLFVNANACLHFFYGAMINGNRRLRTLALALMTSWMCFSLTSICVLLFEYCAIMYFQAYMVASHIPSMHDFHMFLSWIIESERQVKVYGKINWLLNWKVDNDILLIEEYKKELSWANDVEIVMFNLVKGLLFLLRQDCTLVLVEDNNFGERIKLLLTLLTVNTVNKLPLAQGKISVNTDCQK